MPTGDNTRIGLLGQESQGNGFDGLIDDVRIYNRALSADEVKRLYNIGGTVKLNKTSNSLTSGLVGWWTFDGKDMAGNYAVDKSGNGNRGLLTGSNGVPVRTIGKIGQGLSFDGVDDYVNIPGVINLAKVTVSAWAYSHKGATAGNQEIFANKNDTITLRWSDNNAAPGNVPAFFLIIGGSYQNARASTVLSANIWNHLVGTYDGTTLRIYVDGVLAGSTVAVGTIDATTLDSLIGVHNSLATNFFNGLLDDVRIYNRALSNDEIKQLYNMGR